MEALATFRCCRISPIAEIFYPEAGRFRPLLPEATLGLLFEALPGLLVEFRLRTAEFAEAGLV